MAREYSLDRFGASFAMITDKFLKSGEDAFGIECPTKGQAVNMCFRFNLYWKIVRATSKEKLSPTEAGFQDELGDLTMIHSKEEPLLATMARKSERKLDKSILSALAQMEQKGLGKGLEKELAEPGLKRPVEDHNTVVERAFRIDLGEKYD